MQLPSPLLLIKSHPGVEMDIKLYIKRDDLIHPEVSGNKWRKLKYNFEEAKINLAKTIITAGGAWSNHLAATAVAGRINGFNTVGIVRGEEPLNWSDTLKFCKAQGMQLIFISRHDFNKLPDYISQYNSRFDQPFFIPMGGENKHGMRGCEEIVSEIEIETDLISLPVGTGTTLQGIAKSAGKRQVLGFSAVKSIVQHSNVFVEWLGHQSNVKLLFDYNFGGFAKSNQVLEKFIIDFYLQNKIILDPVYTGKMIFGLYDMMNKNHFKKGTVIVAIHTGGLQGIKGYPDLHKQLFTN